MDSTRALVASSRKEVGKFLNKIIEDKNLTKEGLARECGLSKRVIYNILDGKGYTMDSFLTFILVLRKKNIEVDTELIRLLLKTCKN